MNQRSKKLSKLLNINGVMVEAVTISGLARIVGKSRNTILRYEREDVFPPAPLRLGSYRYYPISLAKKLVPIVAKIPPHKKPDAELLCEITTLFNQETSKYA